MTTAELYDELLQLPESERSRLLTMFRAAVPESELPLYPWQKEAIEEALAEYEKHPGKARPSSEVVAELRARYGR